MEMEEEMGLNDIEQELLTKANEAKGALKQVIEDEGQSLRPTLKHLAHEALVAVHRVVDHLESRVDGELDKAEAATADSPATQVDGQTMTYEDAPSPVSEAAEGTEVSGVDDGTVAEGGSEAGSSEAPQTVEPTKEPGSVEE